MIAAGVAAVTSGAARAMTFQKLSGPEACAVRECILASGPVDSRSAAGLREAARRYGLGRGTVVLLDSEGGVLLYGLQLGEEIRRAGFSTSVEALDSATGELRPAVCASACAFAFLGGVERDVPAASRVGVHQIYPNPKARDGLSIADVQLLTSMIAMHIDRMGGGVGILVTALRTPPESVHWFSGEEMVRLGVVRRQSLASN